MNILAIGAHPDDLEILCGGTLAKYAKQGHKVFMAHLTSGNMGGKDISSEELAKIRDGEAKKAGEIIGAEVLGPVCEDLGVLFTPEMRSRVTDIIRQAKPDLIITHSPNDYMTDHIITSQLVFDCAFSATLPHYKTSLPAYEKITPIYYMDTLLGHKFHPEIYIDITDFFETKKAMLACHESQYKWLKGHHITDPFYMIETVARFRGLQAGVMYAEAFAPEKVWGRVAPFNLLPS
ncbi:MAG: PIG-L family deacetylase [Candidatus Hydrogenedentes bacterium]|nr:PIG-L family deacetylase [Candidatus Hydrogenedentota bacterium]